MTGSPFFRLARIGLSLGASLGVACGGAPAKPMKAAPPEVDPDMPGPGGGLPRSPSSFSTGECIVVQGEYGSQPTTVEGELSLTPKAPDGQAAVAPLVLRLTPPRCIVGVPRMSFVTEIYIASSGPDLRPLVGQRLRITGDAIGGSSDLGGPAVVLLAKDIARPPPPAERDTP